MNVDLRSRILNSSVMFCDSSHCSTSQALNKCLHPGPSGRPYRVTLITDRLPTLTVWRLVSDAKCIFSMRKLPTAGVEAQWGSDGGSSWQSSPGLPHQTQAMGLMSPAAIDRSLRQVG
ncbi:unnamed protein product [Tetraodon nigroviridis]|uniref:(spotted green pufferfish) hypothetical protein n=1 Tax=Tetraodon nigroviridis TaxID=99883 RepID=Q4RUD8_TETNG|nr:unnamed protein product [Tetraodon nigroviridis]